MPRLLEYYKDPTLLVQIAEAANMSIKKLLAQNLPRILASYLVKDPHNERYVVKVLSSVCPITGWFQVTRYLPTSVISLGIY